MDQEEGEASPGTVILQDLRDVERKMAVLLQLMAAVEGKTEAQVGSRDLSAMVQKCRDSDIDVHPAIDAWLVVRALETMEVESDEFKSCLDPKCQEAPESCYTISMLSKDRKMQTTVQRRVICQHLGMIMEEPRNSEVLQAFVPVVLQVEILCPDLQEELEDLQRMFSPQDLEANVLNKTDSESTKVHRIYVGHQTYWHRDLASSGSRVGAASGRSTIGNSPRRSHGIAADHRQGRTRSRRVLAQSNGIQDLSFGCGEEQRREHLFPEEQGSGCDKAQGDFGGGTSEVAQSFCSQLRSRIRGVHD